MILNMLIIVLTIPISVALCWSLGGRMGLWFALPLYGMLTFGVGWIAKWRHVRLIRQWAHDQKLAISSIESPAFQDYPGLPWWLSGTVYEVSARTGEGKERVFAAWIHGVVLCLFHIEMTVQAEDPDSYRN